MINTAKLTCRLLADAFAAFGIADVVVCPGSRDVPILMALNRHPGLRVHPVVDERSAAFSALGIACISGNPVGVVCTSGTALLNFAPAVAEAYYRKIPLIVVSADRPEEWIDQADSQTIRQRGALENIVSGSYSLKAEVASDTEKWYANRILNEALTQACHPPCGPVHINIAIGEPISEETETALPLFRKITYHMPSPQPDTMLARTLAKELHNKKVMIVAGCMPPSNASNRALGILASQPNVVVIAEGIANIKAGGVIHAPDLLLAQERREADKLPAPDVLISCGGALVSAQLKKWLRSHAVERVWHVGVEHNIIDTFCQLTDVMAYEPAKFFPRLANAMAYLSRTSGQPTPEATEYKKLYLSAAQQADIHLKKAAALDSGNWNAVSATRTIVEALPPTANLQLSNGMTLRHAQLFDLQRVHRVDSNRGVSGIDGSTSTAVGASEAYKSGLTVALTGDMSFIYDIGALASTLINPRLRIVVFSNGGGGIFKLIKTTSSLPETGELLHMGMNHNIEKIAGAFGFRYFKADCTQALGKALPHFLQASATPCILEVCTDPDVDATLYKSLLK